MKNTAVRQVLQKRSKRLQSRYNDVLEEFGLEDIHDFRLEIKKLNSFLWLLNGDRPTGRLKIKRPLHDFYHEVGNTRNVQLHQQQVGDLCKQLDLSPPSSYLLFLRQYEAAEKKVVRKKALHLNLKKKLKKLLNASQRRVSEDAVKNFLISGLAAVQIILRQSVIQDDDLHELRKIFKRFLYVWRWITIQARADFVSPFLNKETCDKVSTTLGEFMDLVFALRFFKAWHLTARISAEEGCVLQTLQMHMNADKERQYGAVINDLRNLAGSKKERE